MFNKFRIFTGFILPITIFVFGALPVRAEESFVSVLTLEADAERMEALRDSLDSQLVDFDVRVVLQAIADPPPLDETAVNVAEQVLEETGALAVVWISSDSFYFYTRDGERSSYFSRPLPASEDSWELKCDAIASAVRSILGTLLGEPPPSLPPAPAPEPAPPVAKEPEPAPPAPAPVTEPAPLELPPREKPVRAGLELAYAPYVLSKETPFTHGVAAGLRLTLGPYAQLSLDGGFAYFSRGGFSLARIPIRLGGEGSYTFNRFRLGGELSFIVDVAFARSPAGVGGSANRTYPGAGAGLVMGYRAHDRLELLFRGGVDLHLKADRYLDGNSRALFVYGPVHGRFFAGIVVWL